MHKENYMVLGAILGSWVALYFDQLSGTNSILATLAGVGYILYKQIELVVDKLKSIESQIDWLKIIVKNEHDAT
jgi:hypothetical protein